MNTLQPCTWSNRICLCQVSLPLLSSCRSLQGLAFGHSSRLGFGSNNFGLCFFLPMLQKLGFHRLPGWPSSVLQLPWLAESTLAEFLLVLASVVGKGTGGTGGTGIGHSNLEASASLGCGREIWSFGHHLDRSWFSVPMHSVAATC